MNTIKYNLNGGEFSPKDEVKESFYTDLYNFVNKNFDTELKSMSLNDFIVSEPYIIGNMCGKYYLEEVVGGKIEDQTDKYFIGYCYKNKMYVELIPHLIEFFANWREIEGCTEPNAYDFFASAWASLVDTAKFFKYTTEEELKNSPESPSVRCATILNSLQNCPEVYEVPYTYSNVFDTRLPKPKRTNYEFLGWFTNNGFNGDEIKYISKDEKNDVEVYARWATHTFFHSNDGYASFDALYNDFLNDFSNSIGYKVGKEIPRFPNHGPVSEFLLASIDGKLNEFFASKDNYDKWIWLVEYIRSLKKTDKEMQSRFEFKNNKFGLEAQVRWELNSLFVKRFHLVWPKSNDYSGAGVREKIADFTNTSIVKVKYPVGENVLFPNVHNEGFTFDGWYVNPEGTGEKITEINDDKYAAKTIYAKWN